MQPLQYTIQRHDFSALEFPNSTLEEAVQAFEEFDWGTELKQYCESDDKRNCPPSFYCNDAYSGVIHQGLLLHIALTTSETAKVFFFNPIQTTFLWVFKRAAHKQYYIEDYPVSEVVRLIELFADRSIDRLIDTLRSFPHEVDVR